MRILITGGAGFIGSSLSVTLLREKHELTVVDNFHPYYDKKRKLAQLERVWQAGDFRFIEADLLDEKQVADVFTAASSNPYDAVVHLAAIPGVPYSLRTPQEYIDHNIKNTMNVLKWAGESGAGHVVFASSSSVYGDREGPLREGMPVGDVNSPYAAAKTGAESFCRAYQKIYGFPLTILRLFTVYGPWGRPDMAIPIFVSRLLRGESITIYGEGTARDYTYIDDAVRGISAALSRPPGARAQTAAVTNLTTMGGYHSHSIDPARCETYNIGSGAPVSMDALLKRLHAHFPGMNVERHAPRQGDVKKTWADIEKARTMLGYKPLVSLDEGLARTLDWAKSYLSLTALSNEMGSKGRD